MAGETAAIQPGGRAPAPGELALVQAFINSHYDLEFEHGADLLASPAACARWLSASGLTSRSIRVSSKDQGRLLNLREGLRNLARANGSGLERDGALAVLNRVAAGARVAIRFDAQGPKFVPATRSDVFGAIGVLLAITARSMLDGSWTRLKVCPGEDCGWAFYDHSRNQTGRWCSMAVCGGRAKARAHYRRSRRRGTEL